MHRRWRGSRALLDCSARSAMTGTTIGTVFECPLCWWHLSLPVFVGASYVDNGQAGRFRTQNHRIALTLPNNRQELPAWFPPCVLSHPLRHPSQFSESTMNTSTATGTARDQSAATKDDPFESGLWIGRRKRGHRLTMFPDGTLRRVDADFDRSVFDDPDSVPMSEAAASPPDPLSAETSAGNVTALTVPILEPAPDSVQTIAMAMMSACPAALIAVTTDAKGTLIGATITRATKGITPAVFRAAFRSLPDRAKNVTFAARLPVATATRDAATAAADSFLVKIAAFIAG